MRIWYFNHYAGGPGIGKYARAYQLSRRWAEAGHEVIVFLASFHHLLDDPESLPNDAMVGPVRYVALPARSYEGNGAKRLLNMADYCRAMLRLPSRVPQEFGKPDVVIASSPHPFAIFPARRLARRYGAKLVFEVRDLWPLSITEINGTPVWHPFVLASWVAERFAYSRSDVVGSLLGGAESYMRGRGLKRGRFVHVPNGIALDEATTPIQPTTSAGLAAARQVQAWRGEGRTILVYAGAQGVPNGLDRLLAAVSRLNVEGYRERLGVLLVGSGTLTEELKGSARAQGIDNAVFIPPVPKRESLWIIANSDIGYAGGRNQKTIYRYGISYNKIMDYMLGGVPVVLPISAAADPVSASGGGIVTGSDDPAAIAAAIAELIDMEGPRRRQLGERAKAYVEANFDYSYIAANYIAAINQE
jgi:glycosyltransferase involved in cell wall biosynthesis